MITGDEFDRSDLAAVVAEKLGLTQKQVMAVYKATGDAIPQAIAEHGRVELHGLFVARLVRKKGRNFNVTGPDGTTNKGASPDFDKMEIKTHHGMKAKVAKITGRKCR